MRRMRTAVPATFCHGGVRIAEKHECRRESGGSVHERFLIEASDGRGVPRHLRHMGERFDRRCERRHDEGGGQRGHEKEEVVASLHFFAAQAATSAARHLTKANCELR